MKTLIIACVALLFATSSTNTIYDFKVTDIDGNDFNLNTLQGKKVMIVNTASKCGLIPQYEELEKLYETYKEKNFTIIAFPSNDFMSQEPGTDEEIKDFCSKNYGVTFPVMSKIKVKGKNMHPLYKYLTTKSLNGLSDNSVKWNFQKYLIGTDGKLEMVIAPTTKPMDQEIVDWITK